MTDTTHEAPEWIFTTGNSTTGSWNSKKSRSRAFKGLRQTQYIRADLVQAAVAAALREAINRVNGCDRVSEVQPAILALITPDAQTALDRVVAAERERCAKVAESVALPMDGKIAKAQAGYMRGTIAHHIRKGGE